MRCLSAHDSHCFETGCIDRLDYRCPGLSILDRGPDRTLQYLNHYQIKTKKEIEQKLQKAVSLYNNGRPHLSCNMLTPDQVHENKLTPQRLWKNYYKKPIIVNVKQDYPEPVNQ
jgi:hypothetical protein